MKPNQKTSFTMKDVFYDYCNNCSSDSMCFTLPVELRCTSGSKNIFVGCSGLDKICVA